MTQPVCILRSPLASDGGEPRRYRAERLPEQDGPVRLVVLFDGSRYPIERHCRYARVAGPEGPRTFSRLEFHEAPPGIRVGPWPGWRGIPELPGASVSTGGRTVPLRFEWWGDELRVRRTRGVCAIDFRRAEGLSVSCDDPELIPESIMWYTNGAHEIRPEPVRRLESLAGVHPIILISPESVQDLRREATGARRPALERLRNLLQNRDLPFVMTPESKIPPGPESLRKEDSMMIVTLLALVDGGRDHRETACTSYRAYLQETASPGYAPLQVDTQAGETLFLLCLGYDWLYPYLDRETRDAARAWIRKVADVCSGHLPLSRTDVAQAHYLGCGLGLLAFSFLFWDEDPRAAHWAARLRGALTRILAMLPDDGFFPHGGNLWIYEYGFLFRWLELFRICAGEDLWGTTPHWEQASRFRAAMTTPDGTLGVTFGDPQYRIGGDSWCHALVAARTRSGEAQWLADRLCEVPVEGVDVRHGPPRRRVYEFLFHDPALPAVAPADRLRFFTDGGQVFIRSGAGLCTVRCGPPLGLRRREAGEYGAYGHCDPANGAILLYKDGIFLLSGPGPVYRRDTALHNTLTVNGTGQVGDGTVWLPDFFPPEHIPGTPEVYEEEGTVRIAMDLSPAYLPDAGVHRHRRSIVVDESLRVAVADTVVCDGVRRIALHLHTWGDFVFERASGGSRLQFRITRQAREAASLCVLATGPLEWLAEPTVFVPAYPNDGQRDQMLTLSGKGEELTLLWCVCGPGECSTIPSQKPGELHSVRLGDRRLEFSGGVWTVLERAL
jgi:hypothetical protein